MASIISFILSILLAVFPFLSALVPGSPLDDMQFVTMQETESGDIRLVDADGAAVDEAVFSADEADADEPEQLLPSAYDAREAGIITEVKAQGSTGCCWAFAACSAAETNMIKNGYAAPDVNYSEAHLTWFGLRSITDSKKDGTYGDGIYSESPYTDGGNWVRSVFALARWSGAQTEANAPFFGFPDLMGNYDESTRYASYAHLQQSQYIPADDRDGIKQAILDCGSITASYYHMDRFYQQTQAGGAAYYQNSVTSPNHSIAIVGWDDAYAKENFYKTPESDGAWLVKNSWDSTWGDNGYFWLSYCDTSLSYFVTFQMEPAQNYENNNQYDGFGYKGWGYLTGHNQMTAANVFRVTKCDEAVRAVSFYTVQKNVDYTVELYTDLPENGMPTDGTLAARAQGSLKYRGYYTVPLSQAVTVKKGTRYAAVVTYTVEDGVNACVPLEYPDGFDGAHERSYHGEPGQSYITVDRDFTEWEDTMEESLNNVCIKTFSDNLGLRLKNTSPYKIRGAYVGAAPLNTGADALLGEFQNSNIGAQGNQIFLYRADGSAADTLTLAFLGDLDGDGDLDADDLAAEMQIVTGAVSPDDRQRLCGELTGSRNIAMDDYCKLKEMIECGVAV